MNETAVGLLLLFVWLFFCFLVGRAASSMRRPPATWFLLALLLSPLAAYALLLFAGDPEEARERAAKEDEMRQRHPGLKHVREAVLNETQCPRCGATVNAVTEDGLHSPEAEPWLLICNQCESPYEPDL